MKICSICISENPANVYTPCFACHSINFCTACLSMNNNKCPVCNTIQDVHELFIQSQLRLLAETKESIMVVNDDGDDKQQQNCATDYNSIIKACPGCGVWIEKLPEDCNQMYCIICKTIWSWVTKEILTDSLSFHNPLIFKKIEQRKKLRFLDAELDKLSRKIYKSLIALDNEEARYSTEAYLIRLEYIINEIDYPQFKSKLIDLFDRTQANKRLRDNLSKIYNENLSISDGTNIIDNLPFC